MILPPSEGFSEDMGQGPMPEGKRRGGPQGRREFLLPTPNPSPQWREGSVLSPTSLRAFFTAGRISGIDRMQPAAPERSAEPFLAARFHEEESP